LKLLYFSRDYTTHDRRFLAKMAGKRHAVYTGVALLRVEKGLVRRKMLFMGKTMVRLKPLDAAEIKVYFRRIDPMDKAGAYAIQSSGRILSAGRQGIVLGTRGSFWNAVGLPVESLRRRLAVLKSLRRE